MEARAVNYAERGTPDRQQIAGQFEAMLETIAADAEKTAAVVSATLASVSLEPTMKACADEPYVVETWPPLFTRLREHADAIRLALERIRRSCEASEL